MNELGTGERASLAETAGGIASGFIAAPLSRSVGKALDVDLFEITTTDPQTGQTAGGVTLGKQVNDKTFVKFRQQFGNRSFTQFELEYDLARFLRVQTTRRAGNHVGREPSHRTPRRAGGDRFDLLLQLLTFSASVTRSARSADVQVCPVGVGRPPRHGRRHRSGTPNPE